MTALASINSSDQSGEDMATGVKMTGEEDGVSLAGSSLRPLGTMLAHDPLSAG